MIKVIDNWVIEADEYQYVLKEFTGKYQKRLEGTKEVEIPIYKNTTYHSTLKLAVQQLMRHYQRAEVNKKDYSLEEFLKVLDRTQNEFERLLYRLLKDENL